PKKRRFRSRALTILGFSLPFIGAIAGSFFGVPLVISFSILSLPILLNFWNETWDTLRMFWSDILKDVNNDLSKNMYKTLDMPVVNIQGNTDNKDEIISLAIQQGKQQLKRELDPHRHPTVDMIVIIPENPDSIPKLNNFVRDGRDHIFRKDIPVEVMPVTSNGSGGAYLNALQYVQEKFNDPEFIKKYKYSEAKSWQDARVMFVFSGNNEIYDPTILEWAITNGYCTSSSMGESPGGHIIIYSRDAGFFPLQQISRGDISLSAYWTTEGNLNGLGRVDIVPVSGGDFKVRGLSEKLDIQRLREDARNQGGSWVKQEWEFLNEYYDLNNQKLEQFSAVNGIMVYRPRIVKLFGEISNKINHDPKLKGLYIHMISDLIKPMGMSKAETREYINRRMDDADLMSPYSVPREDHFAGRQILYKLIRKGLDADGGTPEMLVNISSLDRSRVLHAKTPENVREIDQLLHENGFDGMAMTPHSTSSDNALLDQNGGIDFSETESKIKFYGHHRSTPENLELRNFQGFDFIVFGLKSLDNPMEFLLLKG
ncbi:MAG: hypothetical protein HQL26_03110, partial [Candidatus Omnitrophica bacterium]|nr:hypothetical protein [Candidatus Omnitrophota bacterium]